MSAGITASSSIGFPIGRRQHCGQQIGETNRNAEPDREIAIRHREKGGDAACRTSGRAHRAPEDRRRATTGLRPQEKAKPVFLIAGQAPALSAEDNAARNQKGPQIEQARVIQFKM